VRGGEHVFTAISSAQRLVIRTPNCGVQPHHWIGRVRSRSVSADYSVFDTINITGPPGKMSYTATSAVGLGSFFHRLGFQ